MSTAIEASDAPGAVIIAGDLVDLLSDHRTTVANALDAHPRLATALARYAAGADRCVVVLPGAFDRRLAWDPSASQQLRDATGATIALRAEVATTTGAGRRTLRVDPGGDHDERFAARDARDPMDTPLGAHLMTEVLPSFDRPRYDGLTRVRALEDVPEFMASRLLYRTMARWSWLLVLPLVLGLAVTVPLSLTVPEWLERPLGPWTQRLGFLAVTSVIDTVIVSALVLALIARSWKRLGRQPTITGEPGRMRALAHSQIADGGSGLIVGASEAQLTDLREGVLATTGACGEVVERRPGRLGLPAVFVPVTSLSWIEIEVGATLHVRLWCGQVDLHGSALVERLVGS